MTRDYMEPPETTKPALGGLLRLFLVPLGATRNKGMVGATESSSFTERVAGWSQPRKRTP